MSSGKTRYNSGKRWDGKKVSWMYRRKKQLQRNSRPAQSQTDNTESFNKNARIIVRNLPFKATEEDVRQLYSPFGKVEEVILLKRQDGNPVGCGFVQFELVTDASRAIFNTNKKEFLGRIINSSWAIPKSKFCEKLDNQIVKDEDTVKDEDDQGEDPEAQLEPQNETNQIERKVVPKRNSIEKQKLRKLQKEKNKKKRARIIVRNLSFQATEEDIRQHFSQYGQIEDIDLLTKGDGKKLGCAFIQFERVQNAAKAIHYANLKPLLDRPVIVDWAVSKNKFNKDRVENYQEDIVEIKHEKESDNEEEGGHTDKNDSTESKDVSLDKSVEEFDSDQEMKEESDNESDELEDDDDHDDEDDVDEDDEKPNHLKLEEEDTKPRFQSHDVAEGKTIFLKNVPFSVNNDELRSYMEQFGPVYYALVCMDPLTEHSKGTAFVKFKYMCDAEKCLSGDTILEMQGQKLEAHKALEKDEVENKAKDKNRREKDSRNLYLVKEGVILAGSPAASGVSASDMARRLQLEQWKSQMLRNLNMFVARSRLVVHNLPPTLDDVKLRKIFERHSNPKAIIREARVMRDLRNLDAKGVGISKEYGFVAYTTHEDALAALRNVNNNPKIFSATKRPIVAFSIENRIMINAKQKRIQKSREQNPLWSGNNEKRKSADASENTYAKRARIDNLNKATSVKPYAGAIGQPGESKLRSKFNLKRQAALHNEVVKKAKKQKKSARKTQAKKEETSKKRQEPKVKQGAKVNPEDVRFSNLVNSYKDKLQSMDLKKSKWYETK